MYSYKNEYIQKYDITFINSLLPWFPAPPVKAWPRENARATVRTRTAVETLKSFMSRAGRRRASEASIRKSRYLCDNEPFSIIFQYLKIILRLSYLLLTPRQFLFKYRGRKRNISMSNIQYSWRFYALFSIFISPIQQNVWTIKLRYSIFFFTIVSINSFSYIETSEYSIFFVHVSLPTFSERSNILYLLFMVWTLSQPLRRLQRKIQKNLMRWPHIYFTFLNLPLYNGGLLKIFISPF